MFSSLGDTALTCSQTALQLIQDKAREKGRPIPQDNLLVLGIFLECAFQELEKREILHKYIISAERATKITLEEMNQFGDIILDCVDVLVREHGILPRIVEELPDIPLLPDNKLEFVVCAYRQIINDRAVVGMCFGNAITLRDELEEVV